MTRSWQSTQWLPDAEATFGLGLELGQTLQAGAVILLEGDLGAGKTSLVQGLGAGLGIAEPVDSPTFTLINEYLDGRVPLYHMDLYRLEGDAARQLYPELYWEGEEFVPGIVAIEWAERLSYLPSHYLRIGLEHHGDGRQANLQVVGQVPGAAGYDLDALSSS
jgi:tRNA threonylcarbamoyladenosine biosynthesis protein TsaE